MTPAELKVWRKQRGLIQRDAGALLGISKRTYNALETGINRGTALITVPRTIELATRGLDDEMKAASGAVDLAGLKVAYAHAMVAIEAATREHRQESLGRMGRLEKKRA